MSGPKPFTLVRVDTKRTTTLELRTANMIALLRSAGYTLPDDALVFFTVPGGGDWSGSEVSIDHAQPLRVTWTEKQTTELSE